MPDAEHRSTASLPRPLLSWLAETPADESAGAERAALARGVIARLLAIHGLARLDGAQPALDQVWRPAGAAVLLDRLLPEPAHGPPPAELGEARALSLLAALDHPATLDDLRRRAPEALSPLFEQILCGGGAARRRAGIYYTPPPIVRYITQNAVGALLAERGPARLRVLDPACGAGAFLLAAARAIDAARGAGQPPALLDLHGVDLDPYAVAATRLTLLLAMPPGVDLELALRTLARRVVWGNALLARADAPGRTDALDWEQLFDGAPAMFDAVVGNPPYLNLKRGAIDAEQKRSFAARYRSARGQYDAFGLFVERGLELLAPDGALSFIVPRPLLTAASYAPVRRMLLQRQIISVADAGTPFQAAVEAAVVTARNRPPGPAPVRLLKIGGAAPPVATGEVAQRWFDALPTISFRVTERAAPLIVRLATGTARVAGWLESLTRGLELGKRDALSTPAPGRLPLLRGEDVARYRVRPPGIYAAAARAPARRTVILVRRVAGRVEAAIDDSGALTLNTLYTLTPRPETDAWLLLACLNSRLLRYYLRALYLADDRLFPYLRMQQVAELPLPHAGDCALQREAGELAGRIQQLRAADSRSAQAAIDAADRRLDAIVYALYGLSEVEIALVEEDRAPSDHPRALA